MSISWQPSVSALIQVGFGAGDIAVMAGAGRAVVTWLTAKFKDAALLEYLGVTPEDMVLRRGLVDTAELKNRWGPKLKLLKDGKMVIQKFQTKLAASDLLLFSWVMSLFSAALDAALSTSHYQDIMTEFVLILFDDHPSEEHLRYELEAHKEGWRSVASVHMILDRARAEWEHLGRTEKHQMGNIPRSDNSEILRLLLWVIKGVGNRFYTSSSDVFCLASVLQAVGIDHLRTFDVNRGPEPQFDEHHLIVVLKADAIGSMTNNPRVLRKGMPIPLQRPEEVISLWPFPERHITNSFQEDFTEGMHAAKGLKFMLNCEYVMPYTKTTTNQTKTDLYYEISSTIPEINYLLKGYARIIAGDYFPLVTEKTAKFVTNLVRNWKHVDEDLEIGQIICQDRESLGRLQSFVMGYYYAALMPLIITSELNMKEAFGSWGWWDYEILRVVGDLKYDKPDHGPKDSIQCWRFGLMKIIAYFFAGAEPELIRRLDNRATGVIAKLCVLTASMLGDATSLEKASQFYLLDIDGSCIPSSQGIVMSGRRTACTKIYIDESMIQPLDVNIQLKGRLNDFTAHIEPDWTNDRQTCLVAFRDHGRIVHRMSPADCDASTVLYDVPLASKPREGADVFIIDIDREKSEEIFLVPLDKFHGGEIITRSSNVSPAWNKRTILIPTQNLPKARTCLRTMYLDALEWEGHSPRYPYRLPPLLKGSCVLYDEKAIPIVFA